MSNKNKFLLGFAALAILFLIANLLYDRLSGQADPLVAEAPPQEQIAEPQQTAEPEPEEAPALIAPDFTVQDAEGNDIAILSLNDRPLVLNFWATWCPYCVQELPLFDDMSAEYGEQVNFAMINATGSRSETVEMARDYIAEREFSFPVYYDVEQQGMMAYMTRSLPATVFINGRGEVVNAVLGQLNEEYLRGWIDQMLADETTE